MYLLHVLHPKKGPKNFVQNLLDKKILEFRVNSILINQIVYEIIKNIYMTALVPTFDSQYFNLSLPEIIQRYAILNYKNTLLTFLLMA